MNARVSATDVDPSRLLADPTADPASRALDRSSAIPPREVPTSPEPRLPLGQPFSGGGRVEPAAHREDGVRLRADAGVLVEPITEAGEIGEDLVAVLALGDRRDRRVERWTDERDSVAPRRVPVEEEVSGRPRRDGGLAGASPRDRRRPRSALGETARRDIVDLDPIVPRSMILDESGVHLPQPGNERTHPARR